MPLILILLFSAAAFAQPAPNHLCQAVFSPKQLFWPGLAPQSKPTVNQLPIGPGEKALARIGVLPIRLSDYRETIPCDSCHRLSANGMEFFLENYLKDRMTTRFPKLSVELEAPHFPLLQRDKIDLLAFEDSLQFPFDRWFDGYAQDLIYRPSDRMTPPSTRKRLDHLGGRLGAAYLLIPARMHVKVTPSRSNDHVGGFDWGFALVFWNVAEGRPEWALDFSESNSSMDLDQSLDDHLDRALVAAWDKLPAELTALWKAEPH